MTTIPQTNVFLLGDTHANTFPPLRALAATGVRDAAVILLGDAGFGFPDEAPNEWAGVDVLCMAYSLLRREYAAREVWMKAVLFRHLFRRLFRHCNPVHPPFVSPNNLPFISPICLTWRLIVI